MLIPSYNKAKNIKAAYDDMLQKKKISPNNQQEALVKQLTNFQKKLLIYSTHQQKNLFQKIFTHHTKPVPKGFYIYGEVGRGKTMLMDLLFSTTAIAQKKTSPF